MSRTSTWKSAEREVAKRLGADRNGPTGEAQADVESNWLAVEVKHRKTLPGWIKSALQQAQEAANPHQLPLAVLHENRMNYDNSLVVIRLADFAAWFGEAEQ